MGLYSHKVIYRGGLKTTFRVSVDDDYKTVMLKMKDVFRLAHTVTSQRYPLKDNKVVYLKGAPNETITKTKGNM